MPFFLNVTKKKLLWWKINFSLKNLSNIGLSLSTYWFFKSSSTFLDQPSSCHSCMHLYFYSKRKQLNFQTKLTYSREIPTSCEFTMKAHVNNYYSDRQTRLNIFNIPTLYQLWMRKEKCTLQQSSNYTHWLSVPVSYLHFKSHHYNPTNTSLMWYMY